VVEDEGDELPADPEEVPPLEEACGGGRTYAVPLICALICGKPSGPAANCTEFSAIRRPLTETLLLAAVTKFWTRFSRLDSWKKLPVNVNENSSGVATLAPEELDEPPLEDDAVVDDDPVVEDDAEPAVVGLVVALGVAVMFRKSTLAPLAAA
jgi:hypothetical protein